MLIGLIGSRITSQTNHKISNSDLCFLNCIFSNLSSSQFLTQLYAMVTLVNYFYKTQLKIYEKVTNTKLYMLLILLCIDVLLIMFVATLPNTHR